jgi:hypothetical protein
MKANSATAEHANITVSVFAIHFVAMMRLSFSGTQMEGNPMKPAGGRRKG